MPNVLTTDSTVECTHSGSVAVSSSAKLKVSDNPVLLYPSSIQGKSISGCTTVASSDSSGPIDVPCTTVSAVTPGSAAKLKVGNQPVALDTLGGTTNGMVSKTTPQALAAPTAGQTKLTAV